MTELGGEVREAETVGGGILDFRYRNVVIEREAPDVESTDGHISGSSRYY
jgi:hypothetical protein